MTCGLAVATKALTNSPCGFRHRVSSLWQQVPEVVPGYPDRILPVDEAAAKELKKRTLTNLYNKRPAWLVNAHKELDDAVAAAYGWEPGLPDDELLARLLELNLKRAGKT